MNGKRISAMVAGITILAGMTAGTVLAHQSKEAQVLQRAAGKQLISPDAFKDATYVGSQACSPCHGKDHAALKDSWHANMLRRFDPSIVKADFNNVEIAYKDVEIEGADKQKVKIVEQRGRRDLQRLPYHRVHHRQGQSQWHMESRYQGAWRNVRELPRAG